MNSGLFWIEPQLTYCTGESARSILIDDFDWSITDGGRSSNCPATDIQITSNNIAEQSPVNAVIGTLTSIDENAGDSHTYSLDCATAGVDDAHFNIVETRLSLHLCLILKRRLMLIQIIAMTSVFAQLTVNRIPLIRHLA